MGGVHSARLCASVVFFSLCLSNSLLFPKTKLLPHLFLLWLVFGGGTPDSLRGFLGLPILCWEPLQFFILVLSQERVGPREWGVPSLS
jgi:hypothetical protein